MVIAALAEMVERAEQSCPEPDGAVLVLLKSSEGGAQVSVTTMVDPAHLVIALQALIDITRREERPEEQYETRH